MSSKYHKPENMTALAHRISELGYHPVPIQPGRKGPTFADWQSYRATSDSINRDFPPHGVVIGVLHDNLGAVDIDVYCPDLAAKLRDEWISRFPQTLERVGQAPKTAFVFRLPDDPYTIRNTQKHKKDGFEAQVEIRTKTGQIVAYGKHPVTKQPYKWPGKDLWETPIKSLRMISDWEVQEYRDWADQQIKQWAGVEDQQSTLIDQPIFKIDLGSYAGLDDGPPKEEAVKEALSYIPADLGHDDWLQVLMGLHDYYNGSAAGLSIAQDWSSAYADYNPREVETKWKSFKGTGVSYSTLFHYAREHGADLSEIGRKHRSDPVRERMEASVPVQAPQSVPEASFVDDTDDQPQTWPTPVSEINALALPRRRWVYGNSYIRKYVTVTASAGGIGKTSLTTVEALAIATGKKLIGQQVKERVNCWILNLEDPLEEMQLRLAAAMQHYGIDHSDIKDRLFMDAEDTVQLVMAAEGRDGLLPNDALLEYMTKRISELNIGCVIIDPFVSTHMVNENSNASIQAVVAMFRKLARDTEAAVHLVHHVRKGNGEDSTIDSVRGAGSLIGAARAARVINKMPEDKAIELGVHPSKAKGIMRIDDGKANLAPPAEAALYARMEGVQLPNDEWVGVATAFQLPDEWAGMDDNTINAILAQIDQGPEEGERYSVRPQDKERWAGNVILDHPFPLADHIKTEGQAKIILKKWQSNGLIEVGEYRSAAQRKDRKGIVSCGRVGEQK